MKEVSLRSIGSIVDKLLFAKDNEIKKFVLREPTQMKKLDLSRLSQVEEVRVEE